MCLEDMIHRVSAHARSPYFDLAKINKPCKENNVTPLEFCSVSDWIFYNNVTPLAFCLEFIGLIFSTRF